MCFMQHSMNRSQLQQLQLCINDIIPSLSHHLVKCMGKISFSIFNIIFNYFLLLYLFCITSWSPLVNLTFVPPNTAKMCIQNGVCTSCRDASMWLSWFVSILGWQKAAFPYLDTHIHWKHTPFSFVLLWDFNPQSSKCGSNISLTTLLIKLDSLQMSNAETE